MGKRLVLVGGGHAHMVTLANLHAFTEKGHSVTVIGPSVHHYYSGMGPGMLGKTYAPDNIRFATKHVVEKQGGAFVLGKAERVDAAARIVHLESGDEVEYDVVSFNAGSHVPLLDVGEDDKDIYTVKPIEKLLDAQARILELLKEKQINISIVGGGPSSVEIAGNLWRLARDHAENMPEIRIFAGKKLMSRSIEGIRRKAAKSLANRGIKTVEDEYVKGVANKKVALQSGEEHETDLIFLALGVKPSSIFEDSGLPVGPDGGLRVNRYLQSVAYPEIFGGGDCIHFEDQPLDKVGVYAVRENPVLFHNLMATLEGTECIPFDPGGDYLLIFNMGDGTGILYKKPLLLGGRLAFFVKDYIDRKFIRKFQSIE